MFRDPRFIGLCTIVTLLLAVGAAAAQDRLPVACGSPQWLAPEGGPFVFQGTELVSVEAFRRFVAHRGVRCGTPLPRASVIARVERELAAARDSGVAAQSTTSIPVAVHVVHNGSTGNLSASQVQSQINHLNTSYQGTGFSFYLDSTDYTNNSTWFNMTLDSTAERNAKTALNIDPYTKLNLYFSSGGGYLGWATFPWELTSDPDMDGVVIAYDSIPGGAPPYGEGDTAVHEIGHWLGLWHTFQPSGTCSGSGDFVSDTPAELNSTFGCPSSRDSCPSDPGNDSLDNFMNYTDDCCMFRFTTGQNTRAELATAIYRSLL